MQALELLVVGDWGRRGAPGQRRTAEGMARAAARLGCAAVVTTGDNFYDDGVAGLDDGHWGASFDDVYPQPALAVPWYVALGNHDYRGRPDAQVEHSRHDGRWRLPARYHAHTLAVGAHHTAQLVVLDTTPFLAKYRPGGAEFIAAVAGTDPAAQLAWLDRTLARSTSRWKLVVGHHPILSGSPYHGSSPELERLLRPRLERHGVHAYLCGHEHDLQHLVAGGVHHLVSGAAAEWRETGALPETRFCHAGLGFLSLSLGPAEMRLRFHDATGAAIYESSARPDAAHRAA